MNSESIFLKICFISIYLIKQCVFQNNDKHKKKTYMTQARDYRYAVGYVRYLDVIIGKLEDFD